MKVSTVAAALAAILVASCSPSQAPPPMIESPQTAPDPLASLPEPREGVVTDRFARLALACVHKEYPNKISHVLNSDADVAPPRDLYPAFHGCFDWHSSVHGHWLLVRILNTDPETPYHDAIIAALSQSFTPENIAGELAYFQGDDRASFERPYGQAWFLQLMTELREAKFPEAAEWVKTLSPLEDLIEANTSAWLGKLAYPIRIGTHNQTAFAFGLMLDWADTANRPEFHSLIAQKAREFHEHDVNCPLSYEPSGEDFLSPCLMEADLMRRVMEQDEFAAWLTTFLPQIPLDGSANWLEPGIVRDASDGKLVHLDGLNLSRAWALEGIASVLPSDDRRRAALLAAATRHKETGVAAVSDAHYAGSHWLASFATYLETRRGIRSE
ncbi:MAG: DUF2891 domain-containing protein [Hyphomonas sp.]